MNLVMSVCVLQVLCTRLEAQAPPYAIQTVAGRVALADGVPATAASLENPVSVAVNPLGGFYISTTGSSLYRVNGDGVIRIAANQRLQNIAADAAGNVYGVDTVSRAYRITPEGEVTVLAGDGQFGFSGDGGPAVAARLSVPAGIAIDKAGNVYIADSANHRLRRIGTDGVIRTIAGTGAARSSGDNGPATSADLLFPASVAVDAEGVVYVAEGSIPRIRRIGTDGRISTLAGNGTVGDARAGVATASPMRGAVRLAAGALGRVYFCESTGSAVWRIDSGTISLVAGGRAGFGGDGGAATAAAMMNPTGLDLDASGRVFVVDSLNSRVRRITPGAEISTVAGVGRFGGDGGTATAALLQNPTRGAADGKGGYLFLDQSNYRIRKVDANGEMSTIAGNGVPLFTADSATARAFSMISPSGVAIGTDGSIYYGEGGRVRRIRPNGALETYAGTGVSSDSGDGGLARAATFRGVNDLAMDNAGNLYVADSGSHRVRRISAAGTISTVAGTGSSGYNGDGILSSTAQLSTPNAVATDKQGNVYIGEATRVRRVTPSGVITTLAGNGGNGSGGDDVPASTAIGQVRAIMVDEEGRVIFSSGSSIYMSLAGRMYRLAGSVTSGFSGDGGASRLGQLTVAAGLWAMGGDIFFGDAGNHRIRRLALNLPEQLEVVGGGGQRGPVSTVLPELLRVRVMGKAKSPVYPGSVRFALESGSATLSAASVSTDADGTAGILVTLGREPGEVVVRAEVPGTTAVRFALTATDGGTVGTESQPRISENGVASAGPNRLALLSPKALMVVRGTGFAAEGEAAPVLEGVCVEAGGLRGLVTTVTPTQIEWVAPDLAAGGTVQVEVITKCDQDGALRSNAVSVQVQSATPELLAAEGSVAATYLAKAYDAESKELITSVRPGQRVTLHAIGLGGSNEIAATLGDVEVGIDGITAAPGQAGVWQVECRIPEGLREGEVAVSLRVSGFESPKRAVLLVRGP